MREKAIIAAAYPAMYTDRQLDMMDFRKYQYLLQSAMDKYAVDYHLNMLSRSVPHAKDPAELAKKCEDILYSYLSGKDICSNSPSGSVAPRESEEWDDEQGWHSLEAFERHRNKIAAELSNNVNV